MINRVIIFVALSATAFAQAGDSSPIERIDYFSSENILKFADHLFEQGDYERASGEYQRYLISVSHDPSSDSIYYRSIRSLFLAGDYDRCRGFLDSYPEYYPVSPRLNEIDLYRAIIYSHEGEYRKSNELLSTSTTRNFPLRSLAEAFNYTNLGDFESAGKVACNYNESYVKTDRRISTLLDDLCRKLQSVNIKYKSPTVAASLAVMPGAGRLYCGNWGDALNSLFIIGLFGYLSYDGFHDDGESSVRGWLFGSIGGVFYAGNIYGSAVAARLYNRKIEDDFIGGIDIDISLP